MAPPGQARAPRSTSAPANVALANSALAISPVAG
jgi:hypothetical protein